MSTDLKLKRFFSLVAFVGTILIGLSLLLLSVFKWAVPNANPNLLNAFRSVGEAIAIVVTAISAFSYVKTKRKPVWLIVYAVSVTAIVILYILNL